MLDDKTAPEGDLQLQSLAHGVVALEHVAQDYGAERRRLQVTKLRGAALPRRLRSFGGVAAFSTAARYPGQFGSLFLQSASLVFTDIGAAHGGGPAFDPVVKFVNSYRARPRRVVERIFMSCGMYEPLIAPNRSMVTTFREAGMEVRYVEPRDGHNWEDWRDRLRDGLTWLHPGDQKFLYE